MTTLYLHLLWIPDQKYIFWVIVTISVSVYLSYQLCTQYFIKQTYYEACNNVLVKQSSPHFLPQLKYTAIKQKHIV